MDAPKTRTKRSIDDRKKALEDALAALQAKSASQGLINAVKAGHVTDVKRAKELMRDFVALNRCRSTIVGLKWATDAQVGEQITKVLAGLKGLVKEPPAPVPPGKP